MESTAFVIGGGFAGMLAARQDPHAIVQLRELLEREESCLNDDLSFGHASVRFHERTTFAVDRASPFPTDGAATALSAPAGCGRSNAARVEPHCSPCGGRPRKEHP